MAVGGGAAPGDTPETGSGATPPDTGSGTGSATPPPTTGTPPVQPAYAVGRPPTQGLYQALPPEHHYTWTLGVDLFGGGGKIGGSDMNGNAFYGSAAGGIRFKSDYLIDPRRKLGIEGYLQITHFNAGANQDPAQVASLDVFDIGVAGYKHLCLRGVQRLCLTPLLGVQLSLMSPANDMDSAGSQVFNYTAAGLRGQISADFAFGTHYQNVVSAMFGFNAYTAVFSSPSDGATAMDVGLDSGGGYAYVGLGYTYRFDTPFGSAPFVTLE
jgi:hypothetical protein